MAFQKGMKRPEGAGRQPGSPNKKSLLKADQVLAMHDLNPTAELLKLIPGMDLEQKIRVWCFLVTYSQAKPTEAKEDDTNKTPDGPPELRDVSNENIVKMIRHLKSTDG